MKVVPLAQDEKVTLDQLKKAAPREVAKNLGQDCVDRINELVENSELRETYRDNIIGYIQVLKDGRFKMEDYLNAVKFSSYVGCSTPTSNTIHSPLYSANTRCPSSGIPFS